MALAVLIIVVLVIALTIFVPFLRSILSGLLRLAFFVVVVFMAIAGVSMLMNNETIFDTPGWKLRAVRFMTTNSAATSEKGVGDAQCMAAKHAVESKPEAAEESRKPIGKHKKEATPAAAAAQPSTTPTPAPEAEDENLYDELMTRNYICEGDTPIAIPRAKLIEMAQQTVNELKQWKLVGTDLRTGILTCEYTTRILGREDDVTIVVTPRSDVELCSQSKTPLLGFFPGDFGANIGHIKEFYAALKPKTDQYCQELEEKSKPPQ